MRNLFFLALVLGLSALLCAQELPPVPVVEAGMTYSILNLRPGGSIPPLVMQGGSVPLLFNVSRSFGLLADLGVYHVGNVGSPSLNLDSNAFTYMFGPRLSWRTRDAVPYLQGLVGGARFSNGFDPNSSTPRLAGGQNLLMSSVGFGVDIPVKEHFTFKVPQVEYLLTRFDMPSAGATALRGGVRVSLGVSFSAGSK